SKTCARHATNKLQSVLQTFHAATAARISARLNPGNPLEPASRRVRVARADRDGSVLFNSVEMFRATCNGLVIRRQRKFGGVVDIDPGGFHQLADVNAIRDAETD